MSSARGITTLSSSPFPLGVSADSRTVVNAQGVFRPILGRTSWNIISRTLTEIKSYIDDTIAKGFNAIEWRWACHSTSQDNNPPFDGAGNLPWTKTVSGATYTGTFATSNTDTTNSPDFSQVNPSYLASVVAVVDYCNTKGVACHLFPIYVGFISTDQGWDLEMQTNGAAKVTSFATQLATALKNYGNVVWMLGGDQGTSPSGFSSGQNTVQAAMITGLDSVAGSVFKFKSAEWASGSTGRSQGTFASNITLNESYSWEGHTTTFGFQGWSDTPTAPCFLDEGPYDEEGPDGNNVNPNATQPVRKFNWWAVLAQIGGYCTGNGFVWLFTTGYLTHMNTVGAQDCARLNAFITGIGLTWARLVPDNPASRTIVTANGGTADPPATDYVGAAVTALGDLMVCYAGPGTGGSFTVAMTKMRGTTTGTWFDPTNASTQSAGSGIANTGTHVFTTPGTNSAGANDWVLKLVA